MLAFRKDHIRMMGGRRDVYLDIDADHIREGDIQKKVRITNTKIYEFMNQLCWFGTM